MSLNINIKATQITLTDAIRDYVLQKIGSLEKVLPADDASTQAQVEVGRETRHHREGQGFKAEVKLHFRYHDLYAVERHEDLYAAIDAVRDEIVHQVNSSIEKRNTLLRRGGRRIKNILHGLWSKKS